MLLKRRSYEVRKYGALPAAATTLPGGSAGAGVTGVYAAAEFGGEANAAAAAAAEQALRWLHGACLSAGGHGKVRMQIC